MQINLENINLITKNRKDLQHPHCVVRAIDNIYKNEYLKKLLNFVPAVIHNIRQKMFFVNRRRLIILQRITREEIF